LQTIAALDDIAESENTEYEEVLGRKKFKFEKHKTDALLDQIEYRGIAVASSPLFQSLPDVDDEAFLEVALAAQASCLVTGNKVHFSEDLCQGLSVFSPHEFLAFYQKQRLAARQTPKG